MNGMKLFAISVVVLLSAPLFADVTCSCILPPGGDCSCRDNQIAICKIRNGVCKATCYDTNSSDDNRSAAARVISDMFDVTPEKLTYVEAARTFDPQQWQRGVLQGVMRQLDKALQDPPTSRIGYVITFSPDERLKWRQFIDVDPGSEIRVAISRQLAPKIRSGVQALFSQLNGLGHDIE